MFDAEFALDVARDDRGRIVAEVWHKASGKTVGIREVSGIAEAQRWGNQLVDDLRKGADR